MQRVDVDYRLASWRMRQISWGLDGYEAEVRTWMLAQPHLPEVLRREYRLLRSEGASPLGARYAVGRMLDMLANPSDWVAGLQEESDCVA